jgi:hypothetical protein
MRYRVEAGMLGWWFGSMSEALDAFENQAWRKLRYRRTYNVVLMQAVGANMQVLEVF